MGGILNHDDSLTDHTDGGVLDVAFKAMQKFWDENYGFPDVPGGMYRGKPPASFFSKDWNPYFEAVGAGGNLHQIEKVGASSTPCSAPSQKVWADPLGYVFDGQLAFIELCVQGKDNTSACEQKNRYVLGSTRHRTGWFHIETIEAHQILLRRLKQRIRFLEGELACDQACSCLPGSRSEHKEKTLNSMIKRKEMLDAQLSASRYKGHIHIGHQDRSQIYYHAGCACCGGGDFILA